MGPAWAGPIEFSAWDIAIILIAAAVGILIVPGIVGGVFYGLYRRRTPPEERTRSAGVRAFLLPFLATLLVLYLLMQVPDWLGIF